MAGLIDTSLIRPELSNAFARGYEQAQEKRNALAQQQQQRQLGELQLQNAMREQRLAGEEEAASKAAGNDLARLQTELFQRGLYKPAIAVGAQLTTQQANRIKIMKDTMEMMKSAATSIMTNPTLENAISTVQAFGQRTGTNVSADIEQLNKLGDNPESIAKWAAGHAVSADKLLPQFETVNLGGTAQRQGFSPLTGAAVGAPTVYQKTATPGEILGSETAIRGQDIGAATAAAGQAVTTRGQDLQNSREQLRAAQESFKVAHTTTDEAGNVTLYNAFGQVIGAKDASGAPVAIKGKPSATFEKTRNQREQISKDLNTAIAELKDITKDGGLIDQSTGSGAGRAVDVAAGFIGRPTPGAIASAKLAPIADLALKMVPRFEGPQSDKDTASYRQAAGQLADPTLPSTIRKEAGKTVLRLMENRKGQFVTQGMAAEGTGAGGGVDTSNPLLAPPAAK